MTSNLILRSQPDLENRVKGMKEDGYVYFPNVLSKNEVSELKTIMDSLTPIETSFYRYNVPQHDTTPEKGGFLNKHINNFFIDIRYFLTIWTLQVSKQVM